MAQGRRATLIDRCAALPADQLDGWLCYWLGVANVSDDATAESVVRASVDRVFGSAAMRAGLCLTAAHAVLSKADSWRTHEGLAVWTGRATTLLDRDVPGLAADEQLLAWTGMLRAVDFAETYRSDSAAVERLTRRSLERLDQRRRRRHGDAAPAGQRGADRARRSTGMRRSLRTGGRQRRGRPARPDASPWALGLWLVAFGAISARYFAYARRGFPYASPEEALRAAIAIGERESLRGVEFGGAVPPAAADEICATTSPSSPR